MKIAILVILTVLITSGIALAGNVYGTITESGKGIAQGSKIEITCGADKYNTETDANGGFKVFVKDQGKCELKLTYQGQTPTFEINSFEGSVQYDLILEKKRNAIHAKAEMSKVEKPEKTEKDFWDKVDVVFRPLNGLLTALTVALLGYYTSNIVRQQETRDSNERVYTQLMSSREQADSGLRKDMFLSIIQIFQRPEQTGLEAKMLNLEMLAYNFHDSLNLKPLFGYIDREIATAKDSDKPFYKGRLNQVSKEIITRQLVLLEQVGSKFSRNADFDKLKANPGGFELEPEKLTLDGTERDFMLSILEYDPKTEQIKVELGVRTHGNAAVQRRVFNVGAYDFPMIDNTRLSNDQRAAIVVNQLNNAGADLTLVYFPGSYASLKEKVSYDEVVEKLRGLGQH